MRLQSRTHQRRYYRQYSIKGCRRYQTSDGISSSLEGVCQPIVNRRYASSDLLPLYIGADPLFGRVFHLYSRPSPIYVAIKLFSSHFQTLTPWLFISILHNILYYLCVGIRSWKDYHTLLLDVSSLNIYSLSSKNKDSAYNNCFDEKIRN